MGVKQLWGILQPVCKKEPLENLRGKTLCVDLSTWICQAEETFPLKSAVAKPYLRNTIFRVLCLRRLGTQLIFVTEGTPPQLKWDAILARAKARNEKDATSNLPLFTKGRRGRVSKAKGAKESCRTENGPAVQPKKIGRSVFQRKINECAQLLRLLGIPVIKSEGEAEACCALLNREKVADGCITEDGDTFLYGGLVVYKDLGISSKDPHVYSYSMENIRAELGIDRKDMIALGLLLGCDYTDGVPGIGKQTAMKLIEECHNNDLLERLRLLSNENECRSSIEKQVFRKIAKVQGFPSEDVIKEFLVPRDELHAIIPQIKWGYPDLVNVQRFCFQHMEWPEEYTLSKVLGVATNEYLHRIPRGIPLQCPLNPIRLVKTRIQHGVPLCEVEWKIQPKEKEPAASTNKIWHGYPETFITLESQQSVLKSLPSLVEEYETSKAAKKKGAKKKKKAESLPVEIEDSTGNELPKDLKLKSEEAIEESEGLDAQKTSSNHKIIDATLPERATWKDSTKRTKSAGRRDKCRTELDSKDSTKQLNDQGLSNPKLPVNSSATENSSVLLHSSVKTDTAQAQAISKYSDALDDVLQSLSCLEISRSFAKTTVASVAGQNDKYYKEENRANFEPENTSLNDEPFRFLSLKERLLSRTSNKQKAKNLIPLSSFIASDGSSKSLNLENFNQDENQPLNGPPHDNDPSATCNNFVHCVDSKVKSSESEILSKQPTSADIEFVNCTNRNRFDNSKVCQCINGEFACKENESHVSELDEPRTVLKNSDSSINCNFEAGSSIVRRSSTEKKHEDSVIDIPNDTKAVSEFEDSTITDNMLLETLSPFSFEAEQGCNSFSECTGNSSVFDNTLDADHYIEDLRRKLNIVNYEASVESPVLIKEESPRSQIIEVQNEHAPVSFMERIRLRSQRL